MNTVDVNTAVSFLNSYFVEIIIDAAAVTILKSKFEDLREELRIKIHNSICCLYAVHIFLLS